MLAVTDAVVLFWVVVQGGSVGKLIERLPADVGPPTPPKRTDNDVCEAVFYSAAAEPGP